MTLRARHVRFHWHGLPQSWLPRDPDVAAIIDVLHLLLPAGERWFCRVLKQALPLVDDPALRADLDGFIRQEAQHARSHAELLAYYDRVGFPMDSFTRSIEKLFAIGADRPFGYALPERAWLELRVAVITAIEHYTTVLGSWILQARALDDAGADATMLDLLRWHGAEEVEHRTVAFETARALGIGWTQRQLAYIAVLPIFIVTWYRGARFLARSLPRAQRPSWRSFVRGGRRGMLPSVGFLLRATARYLRPGHHPAQEGSTLDALAYLARSPAARAAS